MIENAESGYFGEAPRKINIKGREMNLPVFFPDATRGVIRSIDSQDLSGCGVEGLITNTYHLLSQPGTDVLREIGGIKKLMGWNGWIISDSGGFQIFSLIHRNKKLGKIDSDGVTFFLHSRKGYQKYRITPEKCIQIQFDIGSDIMICLDYFTPYMADNREIKKSVDITTAWAKRCKLEFEKQCELRGLNDETRPHLFAVVQGAHNKDERTRSAGELCAIGFDGYGLGGWTLDSEGKMDLGIIEHVAKITPNDKPRYGLGVGNPQAVVDSIRLGYTIFDCVLPTRDARHKRIYSFKKDPNKIENIFTEKDWFEYLYVAREKFATDVLPLSEYCDCHACRNYTRAYINHLFKIEDSLAWRLCTIHNLRTYSKIIDLSRQHIDSHRK